MSLRMAENLTSSVKMPFLRLQFLLSTKKRFHIIVIYVASEIIIFITTKHYSKHVSVTVKFGIKNE